MIDLTSDVDAYLATLHPPDVSAARHLAMRFLDEGMSAATLIDEVIGPAQQEVGRRWQVGQWTVAQEHAATAISDSVLAALSLRTAAEPVTPGRVVTGCVENEWHSLPLRMVTECLALAGYDVVFLGPSLPATHLTAFIADLDPLAVLLSCTNPLNLPGARRTIQAAHDAEAPVIIGGRALDAAGIRAAALGADAYATNAAAAISVLDQWSTDRPHLAVADAVTPEQSELELPRPELIEACLQQLLHLRPMLSSMTVSQLARTREDIGYILGFCSAAMVTHDPTVLDEFTLWLRDLLAPRNVPAATIKVSYEAIVAVLGERFPDAIAMLGNSAALI
jgi:methanogenic corrinoid protein MtbC1